MPGYEVRPIECEVGVFAIDAGAVFQIASQLGCNETDVFHDGRYAFSLRLNGRSRFWTIFQRQQIEAVAA